MKRLVFILSLLLGVSLSSFSINETEENLTEDSLNYIGQNIQRLMASNLDSMRYWIHKMERITEKKELSSEHSRTLKFYGEYYNRVGNPDSAFYCFEKSMDILLEIGDSVGYARHSLGLGQSYALMGQNENAIETFQKGLRFFVELNDSLGIAILNDNLGTNLQHWGEYNEALEYLLTANRYYRELGFKVYEGNTFNTIALIYRQTDNQKKELEYYKKALAILETEKDSIRLGLVSVNLGDTYVRMDSLKKGLALIERAEQLFTTTGYQYGLLSTYNSFVQYYESEKINNEKKAEEYALKNRSLATEMKAYKELVDASHHLGYIYNNKGEVEKAIEAYKATFDTAMKYDFPVKGSSAAQYLAVLHETKGQYKLALEYLRQHQLLEDSLLNKKQIEEFKEIELKHEFAQERLEDSLKVIQEKQAIALVHQKELLKEQQSKSMLYFGLIIIAVIASFSIWAYSRQQKQAKVLAEKNTTIEKALHEKQLLLKEVHHRVKNNFQIVSSLLEMQTKGIEDEKAKELAEEGKNRVKSMALIHQKLYQNDDLLIYFDDYIDKLVKEISIMYQSRTKANIALDVPKLQFDIDTAIPLGLIVNELLTNAFKYGGDEKGNNIQISLKEESSGNYNLKVSNSGSEMPAHFDFNKAKSLGLRLVKSLSKQLQGSVSYSSNNGTTFNVHFKNTFARNMVD